MKRFLTISPREGSEPRAATSATSGTGSSCHFAAATSTKRKFDNANYDKEKRKRTFQDQWFGEFAWLSYTSGNDTMACNVCRKFTRLSDPKSALVLGTNKFRKDPLKECFKIILSPMLDVYRGLISNPPSQLTHILVLIELMPHYEFINCSL